MGGRWEVRRSLETEDLGEARRRAVEVARWAEQQLAAARAQIAPMEADHEAERDRLLDRLTPAWKRWEHSLNHNGVLLGPEPQQWRDGLAPLMAPLAGLEGSPAGPSLGQLVEAWAVEQAPPPKTVAGWTRTVERFVEHLGHGDAERVSRKDVLGWKDHLLSQGLSPTTVKDMVGTLKTVYNLALHNERLARADNPAQSVKVARRRAPGTDRRGYTLEEAGNVLRACLDVTTKGSRSEQDVAWTVLLMASTGARLGEIAGALVGDIRHDAAGGWYLTIEASEERGLSSPPSWLYACARQRPGVAPNPDELSCASPTPGLALA